MSSPKPNNNEKTVSNFDASSIFKMPSLFQGLTSGNRGFISSIVQKIHSLWNSDECRRDENENLHQREPLAKLVLNFFRHTENRLRNSSGQNATSDSDNSKRSPSTCRHRRHSHISTWSHSMHIHYTDVPKNIREPYIEYGYLLPFMPWRYYLKAMYIPNYELMNIWTHLVPCIYFFYLLFSFSTELNTRQAWPLLCLTFSSAIMAGSSSLAHMLHGRSGLHHCKWFMVDYFGITAYAFSSLLAHFYTGSQMEYFKYLSLHYVNLTVTMAVCGFLCFCMTQTGNRWMSRKTGMIIKILVNLIGYMVGLIPILYRMLENADEQPLAPALQYYIAAMISLTIGPILYSTDFPQKFWPGRFNVLGHSHQIFHVTIATGVYFDIQAVYLDVSEGPWIELCTQDDYPLIENVLVYFLLLLSCSVVLAVFLCNIIKDDHKHEAPFLEGRVLCSCGLPDVLKYDRDADEERNEEESYFKED